MHDQEMSTSSRSVTFYKPEIDLPFLSTLPSESTLSTASQPTRPPRGPASGWKLIIASAMLNRGLHREPGSGTGTNHSQADLAARGVEAWIWIPECIAQMCLL